MLADSLFEKLADISDLFLELATESETNLTSEEQTIFNEMSDTILDILADHTS